MSKYMTRLQSRVKKRAKIRGWNKTARIASDLGVHEWQVQEAIVRLRRKSWVRPKIFEKHGTITKGIPKNQILKHQSV